MASTSQNGAARSVNAASLSLAGGVNATPKKKPKRHRLAPDYTASKEHLDSTLKSAKKALAAVNAEKKHKRAAAARLVAKSTKFDNLTLVKVIEIRQDLPDIVCPHCQASQPVGIAVRKAHDDVLKKKRAVTLDQKGKPLASAPAAASTTASPGSGK